MCLILFAWQAHPKYALVIAANRDELRGYKIVKAPKLMRHFTCRLEPL